MLQESVAVGNKAAADHQAEETAQEFTKRETELTDNKSFSSHVELVEYATKSDNSEDAAAKAAQSACIDKSYRS